MHTRSLLVIQRGREVEHSLCGIFFKLYQLCVELSVFLGKSGWIYILLILWLRCRTILFIIVCICSLSTIVQHLQIATD